MTRRQVRVGDVFTMPLDDARVGYGQIVAKYGKDAYFFAIFEDVHPRGSEPDIAEVLGGRILFLALSLDAKLAADHWQVVEQRPVREDVPLPAYKEVAGTPDQVDVVDYTGQRRRRSNPGESRLLRYRKVVAPVRLEKALRARHGLEPWRDEYAELKPIELASTKRLFD